MNNRYLKIFPLVPVVLFGLFLLFATIRGWVKTYNLSVNGVIEKIRYEEPKHIAYPIVRGKEYDLWYSHCKTYDSLKVGDSIVKKSGVDYYILIKK